MAKLFEYDESRTKERRRRFDARSQRAHRAPNPVTPIPRRASASSPHSSRVRSRHPRSYTEFQEEDVTRLPTIPRSATWQDEVDEDGEENSQSLLPVAVAEFSPLLPSSPSIDELDTLPPTDTCELPTNPPPGLFQSHNVLALYDEPSYIDDVVEADTVMDNMLTVVPSLPSELDLYPTRIEDVVDVALTLRARKLLLRKGSMEDRPAFIHDPLDYMRWWLLSPGRLEFLFWLGGALLLGAIMCAVLVMTGLGLGWMSFGHLGH